MITIFSIQPGLKFEVEWLMIPTISFEKAVAQRKCGAFVDLLQENE
jgi:hypothetical protein